MSQPDYSSVEALADSRDVWQLRAERAEARVAELEREHRGLPCHHCGRYMVIPIREDARVTQLAAALPATVLIAGETTDG